MATYSAIEAEHLAAEPLKLAVIGKDGKPTSVVVTLEPFVSSTGGLGYREKPRAVCSVTRCGESLPVRHTGLYFMLDISATAGADEAREAAKAAKLAKAKAALARAQADLAKMQSID